MRLLPRSLLGRLVLVLLGGLVVAQLVSFAIHMHERGELLAQASGMRSAQRIADIVKLLDTLTPAERRRIVQAFSAPPVAISLDEAPFREQSETAESGARAALFGAMLRRFLGDDRTVAVKLAAATAAPAEYGGKRGFRGSGMHGDRGPPWEAIHAEGRSGSAFVVQVRLLDGALVTFNARPPPHSESWPYRLLASVAVLLVAVVALSWIAVRWATQPLNALADAADELGRNLNRPPMAEKGPVEVIRAARAFNTMQARLVGYLRDRTRVLAAMSHDLKTPITRLRLRSELLDDPQLRAKFTGDLEELESMVGSTLDFLRGLENGEPAQPVDILALLESLQADLAELGGPVTVEGTAGAPFPGRPQALKRCFANLLENAVKYGKSARVIVDDDATRLQVRIQDQGPGIPQAELERVFDPFYRLEGSRNRETGGTGLGLAIARSVAEAHGGTLVLQNREEGGLEALLMLPRRGVPEQPAPQPRDHDARRDV
jgi:signal transduction histidine kinase